MVQGLKPSPLCMLHICLLPYCISSLREMWQAWGGGTDVSQLCSMAKSLQTLQEKLYETTIMENAFLSYRIIQFFEVTSNI